MEKRKFKFETIEQQKEAANEFSNLINNPGWQLLVGMLEEDIEMLSKQILDGLSNDGKRELTFEEIKRLREIRRLYIKVKDYPRSFVEKFVSKEGKLVRLDPYDKPEDIRKRQELEAKKRA